MWTSACATASIRSRTDSASCCASQRWISSNCSRWTSWARAHSLPRDSGRDCHLRVPSGSPSGVPAGCVPAGTMRSRPVPVSISRSPAPLSAPVPASDGAGAPAPSSASGPPVGAKPATWDSAISVYTRSPSPMAARPTCSGTIPSRVAAIRIASAARAQARARSAAALTWASNPGVFSCIVVTYGTSFDGGSGSGRDGRPRGARLQPSASRVHADSWRVNPMWG